MPPRSRADRVDGFVGVPDQNLDPHKAGGDAGPGAAPAGDDHQVAVHLDDVGRLDQASDVRLAVQQ